MNNKLKNDVSHVYICTAMQNVSVRVTENFIFELPFPD